MLQVEWELTKPKFAHFLELNNECLWQVRGSSQLLFKSSTPPNGGMIKLWVGLGTRRAIEAIHPEKRKFDKLQNHYRGTSRSGDLDPLSS
jgi:hypothetical protein